MPQTADATPIPSERHPGDPLEEVQIPKSQDYRSRPPSAYYLFSAIMAAIAAVASVAISGDVYFMLLAIGLALLMGVVYVSASKRERMEKELETKAEQESREQLKKEVAAAVKDTYKETIMVRCRYCGSLNDESASKCDSCGATL